MENWYSVRMRSSQGAPHENGGIHISGAERLVEPSDVKNISYDMIQRAMNHSRGNADFISLKIETIRNEDIQYIAPLHVKKAMNEHYHTTKQVLQEQLFESPISESLISSYYEWLLHDNVTRGAIIVDVNSGERVDPNRERGIRVSHFDWQKSSIQKWPKNLLGVYSERRAEAIALASKVAAAGTICELCCSDDPEYTTGYLTYQDKYIQIPNMKKEYSPYGGRVFFIDSTKLDLDRYIHYLEEVPVLVGGIR